MMLTSSLVYFNTNDVIKHTTDDGTIIINRWGCLISPRAGGQDLTQSSQPPQGYVTHLLCPELESSQGEEMEKLLFLQMTCTTEATGQVTVDRQLQS